MIKENPQINHVEETVNIKWCVSKVLQYIFVRNVLIHVFVYYVPQKRTHSCVRLLCSSETFSFMCSSTIIVRNVLIHVFVYYVRQERSHSRVRLLCSSGTFSFTCSSANLSIVYTCTPSKMLLSDHSLCKSFELSMSVTERTAFGVSKVKRRLHRLV